MLGQIERVALIGGQRGTVGVAKDVEALGVRLHQSVLDAVVDHLDEVAGAGGTAVQEALGAVDDEPVVGVASAPPGWPRSQRPEERRQPLDDVRTAADHQAVAALGAPDAAGRADVDVVDALRRERSRPAHVVLEVRVAAVDDHVAGRQAGGERR